MDWSNTLLPGFSFGFVDVSVSVFSLLLGCHFGFLVLDESFLAVEDEELSPFSRFFVFPSDSFSFSFVPLGLVLVSVVCSVVAVDVSSLSGSAGFGILS